MNSRRALILAVVTTAALTACSGGGSVTPRGAVPQQNYHSTTPKSYSPGPFLYAASFDRVNLYKLPITNSSTVYTTLTGFRDARDVKVENNDVDVADSTFGYNAIITFDQVNTAIGVSFNFECAAPLPEPFAEAIHGDHLYVVLQGIISGEQFLTRYSEDTPCGTSHIDAYTNNGVNVPRGVAVNSSYIFVANSNGNSIAVYQKPLHTGDAPIFTKSIIPAATNLVANDTALYVTSYNNGLERFRLPLGSAGPTATVALPQCGNSSPYGVEDYNGYVYVSDPGCSNIYLYKKPIYTGESPAVTLSAFAAGIDIH